MISEGGILDGKCTMISYEQSDMIVIIHKNKKITHKLIIYVLFFKYNIIIAMHLNKSIQL